MCVMRMYINLRGKQENWENVCNKDVYINLKGSQENWESVDW